LYEFWPELEQHNVTRDAPLQEELSKELLAACAVMVQHTRICYIRVDKVGGWVGACGWERVGGWWSGGSLGWERPLQLLIGHLLCQLHAGPLSEGQVRLA
jgi:hypothetical protein